MLKKAVSLAAFVLLFFLNSQNIYSANITSIAAVTITPPSPTEGSLVQVDWDYTLDSAFNNPHYFIVISETNTLRSAATAGQWVVIGNGCSTPAVPAAALVTGGCSLGSNLPSGISHGSVSFNLPAGLSTGVPYYIIVGMKDYNVYLNPSVDVQQQGYSAAFTLPLPPASAVVIKTTEGTNTAAGYRMLYTIEYNVVNTQNFIISDPVPAELSFVKAYNGGALSGGNVVWNFGNVTARQTGKVSWMGAVNAGVMDGTVISNRADYSSVELGNNFSNTVTMTAGPNAEFGVVKSASVSNANAGDIITYTISMANNGFTAEEYIDFSSPADISDWTVETPGGTWSVAGGILTGTTPSGWPKLIKNTPSFRDAMYMADMYVPSSNAPGDAVMIFNYTDMNNMYHARFQADAHEVCLDKVVGGAANWSSIQCVSRPDIVYDKWYTVKVVRRGANIRMKAWERGTTEPATWDININDTSLPSSGRAGFQINEVEDRFDNLKIFGPGPALNARVYDTLPACTTLIGGSPVYSLSGGIISWDFPGRFENHFPADAVSQRSFWVSVDSCAAGQNVTNTACIDSDESSPAVCSNEVYVTISGLPMTATVTPTVTATPTRTATLTPTITATPTMVPPHLTLTSVTNYPNPFADQTTLVYDVTAPSDVTIKIYTISGELIRTMRSLDGGIPTANIGRNYAVWDGKNDADARAASGIYVYRIEAVSRVLPDEKEAVFNRCAVMR